MGAVPSPSSYARRQYKVDCNNANETPTRPSSDLNFLSPVVPGLASTRHTAYADYRSGLMPETDSVRIALGHAKRRKRIWPRTRRSEVSWGSTDNIHS